MAVGRLLAAAFVNLAKHSGWDFWLAKLLLTATKLICIILLVVVFQASNGAAGHALFPDERSESYRLLYKTQENLHRVRDDEPSGEFWNQCKLQAPKNIPITFFSEGFNLQWMYAPSTGFIKAGMQVDIQFDINNANVMLTNHRFFVDFPNAPGSETPNTLYRALMPDADNWYNMTSYGRLRLNMLVDMSRFYRMPSNSNVYGWNSRALTGQMQARYITDALLAFGSKPEWGELDVLYIVPTRAAKEIWFSPTFMGPMRMASGNLAKRTVTFGQDMWTSWGFKVLNHETAHAMGLPDLYPLDTFGLSTTVYTGGWDIMGLITGTAPDYFAWHKWKLKWIDDIQVSCVTRTGITRHILTPLELAGGLKMIAVKLNDTSILAIELRSRQGVDRDTCTEGLLFYVVDVTKASGYGPIRVIDPRNVTTAGCSPARGGPLTKAAMDITKNEWDVRLPQYGVDVHVEAKKDQNYWVLLHYDGRNQWIQEEDWQTGRDYK